MSMRCSQHTGTSTCVNMLWGRVRPRKGKSMDVKAIAACCEPVLTETLGEDEATELAAAFKVLADPARLRLLSLIANAPGGGVSDGLAGVARLGGGALSDDPSRRRSVAVGGYTSTAVLSSAMGAATAVWQVGFLRAGAWAARGLRVPARNALLADIVDPA